MKRRTKLIIYLIILLLTLVIVVKGANAQEPVRQITNCPYGDSATKEVCEKLTEDNKPEVQQPKSPPKPTVEPTIYEPFEGK